MRSIAGRWETQDTGTRRDAPPIGADRVYDRVVPGTPAASAPAQPGGGTQTP